MRHKGIKRESRVIIEEGCFCPAVVAWHYFHAGAPGVICPATFRCAHFFLWRRSPKEWKKERRPHASIGGVYTHRYTDNNWWMADIRVICLQSWTACCVEWTRNKREEKGRKGGRLRRLQLATADGNSSSARSIVRLLMSGGRCQKGQVRCPTCTTQLPVHI